MQQNLKSKTQLAQMARVSNALISRLTKPGQKLHAAMVGKKINISHVACLQYLVERDSAPDLRQAEKPKPSGQQARKLNTKYAPAPTASFDTRDLPPDIQKLADLPLRKLVAVFGTDVRFKDWLDALKRIEEIHEKRIKNSQSINTLISQDIVKKCVIDPFERAHRLLLTDCARSMAQRLQGKFRAGSTAAEGERYIQNEISKVLSPAKKKIAESLRVAN